MRTLIALLILAAPFAADAKRFRIRITDGNCHPTPTQISNRTSTGLVTDTPLGAIPDFNVPYCDDAFGTRVMRVTPENFTDPNGGAVDMSSVALTSTQQAGFNSDNTRLIIDGTGGAVLININQSGASPVVTSYETLVGNIKLAGAGTTAYANYGINYFWDATDPNILYFVSNVQILRADLSAKVGGFYQAVIIADLSAVNASAEGGSSGYVFWRCSASYSVRQMACADQAIWDGSYKRIGWIAFQITDLASSASPTTNYTVLGKFINGIDSTHEYDYQSYTIGSQLIYPLSPNEAGSTTSQPPGWNCNGGGSCGGYKFTIDRSGDYVIFASTSTNGLVTAMEAQVAYKLSDGSKKILQGTGHGDPGNGKYFAINSFGYQASTPYYEGPIQRCDQGIGANSQYCWRVWDYTSLATGWDINGNHGSELSYVAGGPSENYTSRFYASCYEAANTRCLAFTSCPQDAVCPSTQAYAYHGELYNVNLTTAATSRFVKTHLKLLSGYQFIHAIASRDGQWAAFATNYGSDTRSYVSIVRMP
jgi:hypothetical protein